MCYNYFEMRQTLKVIFYSFLGLSVGILLPVQSVFAQQASSPNYQLNESFFGIGGDVDSASNNYRSRQSAGALGVGDTSSNNYRSVLGNVTPDQPYLEMVVTGNDLDLGELSSTSTSYGSPVGGTCGCSFYVRTYFSTGYVVVNASSNPPTTSQGYSLTAKSVQGAPSGSASVEEFGMNLVANTSPGTFGANPVNQPDNTFADGVVSSGYDTANQFKFGAGDIMAESPATVGNQGDGQTDYTISYIAKKKNTTPAGNYVLNHEIVVIATF